MKRNFLVLGGAAGIVFMTAGTSLAEGRHGFDFTTLDADGDGTITAAELSAAHLARFDATDADGNGEITEAEILARLKEMRPDGRSNRMERMAARMIRHLDDDDSGAVSSAEFAAADRSERILERLDEDGDGSISAAEAEDAKGKRGRRGKKDKDGKRGDRT